MMGKGRKRHLTIISEAKTCRGLALFFVAGVGQLVGGYFFYRSDTMADEEDVISDLKAVVTSVEKKGKKSV